MASLKSFLSMLFLLAFASHVASRPIIEMFLEKTPLRSDDLTDEACESWKFSFEANNLRNVTVPLECVPFIENYMYETHRYVSDLYFAVLPAFAILPSNDSSEAVKLNSDEKDAWIFDVDETLLSNLPYYMENGYGSETFDETAFYEWAEKAEAPANPAGWFLYLYLQQIGIKTIILTGRDEFARNFTEQNLQKVGYVNWDKLIMRGPEDQGKEALVYKREKMAELVKEGYTLLGNVGDQWSDLLGSPPTTRTFKFPNPMYYIP